MRSIHHTKKSFSLLIIVVMLFSTMYFPPATLAAELNESESNNTGATADVTYDDYDNRGTISSISDVDWWKITPTASGLMNFWLGNIPSGCNYNMYLCQSNGAVTLAHSTNNSNTAEKMRIHVKAGTTYYIKITSASGSSTTAKYLFRAKRYDLKEARIFASDVTTTEGTDRFTDVVANTLPRITNMGYTARHYENYTAVSAYSLLPTSEIFYCDSHGGKGYILFYDANDTVSYLYANNTALLPQHRSLSTLYDGELTNVSLVMYSSCHSGDEQYYGNLVEMTANKGAWCAVGWRQTIPMTPSHRWTQWFFGACSTGLNVYDAMENADETLYDTYYDHYAALNDREITESCHSVILG